MLTVSKAAVVSPGVAKFDWKMDLCAMTGCKATNLMEILKNVVSHKIHKLFKAFCLVPVGINRLRKKCNAEKGKGSI